MANSRAEYMRDYRARRRVDPCAERIAELEAEVAHLTAALETWRYILEERHNVIAEVSRAINEQIEGTETHREAVVPHGAAEGFVSYASEVMAQRPTAYFPLNERGAVAFTDHATTHLDKPLSDAYVERFGSPRAAPKPQHREPSGRSARRGR